MNIAEHTVGAWPTSDLQALGCCPACGHLERRSLMQGLTDVVFRAAPGQWEMWRCGACGTAYLDPRPDEKSIGRAYSRYYTHAGNASLHSPLRLQDRGLRAAARRLRNGYLNARYGHALDGWTSFGWMLPLIAPKAARRADHLIRHLPPSNGSDRLLDVGCGSGEWLATARLLGYQVFGLEPDVTAAATAAANGYDVRSGVVPGSGYRDALFDQVTLNHVFEHLHWPVDALNELHRILKPGGRLWISMPNLSAQGLRQFERHWRGLEVPRLRRQTFAAG
jgi:SAM-dependent methyltransferase